MFGFNKKDTINEGDKFRIECNALMNKHINIRLVFHTEFKKK